MIPWILLDSAPVPGGGELRLMRRGAEFSIFAGPTELMGSRSSGSEQALASLSCSRLVNCSGAEVLIGGLGMGFTLREALSRLRSDARVTVAELVPKVIDWARGPLAGIHGDSLADPRLVLFPGDVGAKISGVRGRYDAILLDVDNGPAALMRAANDDLYDEYGLREAYQALVRGGVLGVWSSGPDADFTKRLQGAGFQVEDHRVRSNGSRRGARHVVWLATRPSL